MNLSTTEVKSSACILFYRQDKKFIEIEEDAFKRLPVILTREGLKAPPPSKKRLNSTVKMNRVLGNSKDTRRVANKDFRNLMLLQMS